MARKSDDEIIEEVSKDIYTQKGVGEGLKALLQLAIGEKAQGLATIKADLGNDEE